MSSSYKDTSYEHLVAGGHFLERLAFSIFMDFVKLKEITLNEYTIKFIR